GIRRWHATVGYFVKKYRQRPEPRRTRHAIMYATRSRAAQSPARPWSYTGPLNEPHRSAHGGRRVQAPRPSRCRCLRAERAGREAPCIVASSRGPEDKDGKRVFLTLLVAMLAPTDHALSRVACKRGDLRLLHCPDRIGGHPKREVTGRRPD